jgi:general secretion pathway protein I
MTSTMPADADPPRLQPIADCGMRIAECFAARSEIRNPKSAIGTAGFTLLEVMVALAVVAFAFVSLLSLQVRNIQTIGRGQDLTRATLLARELIAQIQVDVATGGFQQLGDLQGTFEGFPGFRFEREVESTGLDELRMVTVRVIWDERNPRACELVYFVREDVVS